MGFGVVHCCYYGKILYYNTGFCGDKILYKNLDLTQDFQDFVSHFMGTKSCAKSSQWPKLCSLGKILAQDFQMAAVTEILMRREYQLRCFFPWGISRKHLKHKNSHGDCDAAMAKVAAAVTHVQSLS